MIKTILAPLNGDSSDDCVFATALAVGRPLGAHVDFYHVRLTPCEAAVRSRHVEFCVGSEINTALEGLRQADDERSLATSHHFAEFCPTNAIVTRLSPESSNGMSAQLLQETDHAEARLRFRAQHTDMVVIGRPRVGDLMPYNLIETLLLRSGRPILVASDTVPADLTDTIVIGWKDTPEAARAINSATPLLKMAGKVVLVHVARDGSSSVESLAEVGVNLARRGIPTESRLLLQKSKSCASVLQRTAADLGATLLVVGGYGHNPVREAVFGGVTRALIEQADIPVFLMH